MEGAEVTIVHRGGTTKRVHVNGFDDVKRPIVTLHFPMAGLYRANLNHGWLESPCGDWRVEDSDLEKLRAWANEKEHWVSVVPRSTGRPVQPKRGTPASSKQPSLLGDK